MNNSKLNSFRVKLCNGSAIENLSKDSKNTHKPVSKMTFKMTELNHNQNGSKQFSVNLSYQV
jgi:hypothetical protein